MIKRLASPLPVVEWSPDRVRVFDPKTGTIRQGSSVVEAAAGITGKAVLALSRRISFLRSVRLPDLPKNDVINILNLQVASMFPVPQADLAYDFAFSEDRNSEGRAAVVAAVRSESLKQALAELDRAGLSASAVIPAAMAASLALEDGGIVAGAVVGLVPEGLAIDIVQDNAVVFTRSLPSPADADATGEEVCRTFTAARLPCGTVATYGSVRLHQDIPLATDPLGLLGKYEPSLSLELPEVRLANSRKQLQQKKTLALFLCVAALGVGAVVYDIRSEEASMIAKGDARWKVRLRNARSDKATAETRAKLLAGQKNDLEVALLPKQPFSDVMVVFTQLTTPSLWLTGMTMERGKLATIRGTALTSGDVTNFLASLSKQSRFRDVKLIFANKGQIESTSVVNFSISAHIVGNFPLPDGEKGGSK